MFRIRVFCSAVACALATPSARATPQALVVEPAATQTLVLATARGTASAAARDVAVTVVAGPPDAARVARILPRYDPTSTWTRIAPRASRARVPRADVTTLDPAATQFVLVVARPKAAMFAAFVERLEARFVRERLDAQVWSVVARARDCALLDARAVDFARIAAESDARELSEAAGRELIEPVASANVTPASDDPDAFARRCALGTPHTPLRRIGIVSLTDTSARVTSRARIAIAFATARASGAAKPSARSAAADDESAAPLYGTTNAATRLRLDAARLGPTIAVVGTSARLRPAATVRYTWTSLHGGVDARAALRALEEARLRLLALGVPRESIVARVRSGPTFPINLFVDVPAQGDITGDAVAKAIGGDDARIDASIGETFVRVRCDAFEANAAREAVASAQARANDLARALGTTPRAPLAIASRGVVAPRCTARDVYAPAAPRGAVVGGPRRPAVVATYASVIAAYRLAVAPAIAAFLSGDSGANVAPESYFRIAADAPADVDVAIARARAPLTVRGIATRYMPAERAVLNVVIASDAAHRFASVDPLRAYALAAPLERIAGRVPTRVVIEPSRLAPISSGVALHLELRAPLDPAAQARLRELLDGAHRLGTPNVQLVFETSQTGESEAAARRGALADAFAAATREAAVRRVRLERLDAVVEAEPYVDRSPVRDPRRALDQRVALVMRVDATYTTKGLRR